MTSRVSLPLALLLVLTSGTLAFFIYYGQWFPPTMAVHFNPAGEPDAWMDRIKFIVIGSSLSFMLPAFIVACAGVLPRVLPVSILNLPNKEYWLAPERREATLVRLLFFALWLGCLVQAFMLGLWITIGRANFAGASAHLSGGHAFLAGGFLVSLALYVFWIGRAFSRPR